MNESNSQDTHQVRCGIYTRSATANPSAIARQITSCREIAQRHEWQVDERFIYVDDGVGGLRATGRPGLEQLLAILQSAACPINRVLVEDFSRLGRDSGLVLELLEMMSAHGVTLYALDTSAEVIIPKFRQLFDIEAQFVERFAAPFGLNP